MPDIEDQSSKDDHVEDKNDVNELNDSEIKGLFRWLDGKLIPEENETTLQQAAPSQGSKPKIQWAPPMLSNNLNFSAYLQPKVLFLGLTCHINGETDQEKEELKLRLAAMFIKDYSLLKSVFNDIFIKIEKFTECYDLRCWNSKSQQYGNDKVWSSLLLVDGCALLFFIVCYMLDDLHKLKMTDEELADASNDIFLLENQLPYGLLTLLMKGSELAEKGPSLIHEFVKLNCIVQGNVETGKKTTAYDEPDHILGLMWTIMRGTDPLPRSKFVRQLSRSISYPSSKSHMDRDNKTNPEKKKGPIHWSPSHSINELKAVWIDLMPGSVLKDISFCPGMVSGKLTLPRLIINDSTAVKLTNLIAYEMCPNFQNDLELTSYICFLNSFVANGDDVAELRVARVLINYLSSDGEVLKLFRNTASTLVPNPTTYHLIKDEIQKHFERKGRKKTATWLAEAALIYFKTPWRTIATLAAALTIILTATQAYFAAFPQKN